MDTTCSPQRSLKNFKKRMLSIFSPHNECDDDVASLKNRQDIQVIATERDNLISHLFTCIPQYTTFDIISEDILIQIIWYFDDKIAGFCLVYKPRFNNFFCLVFFFFFFCCFFNLFLVVVAENLRFFLFLFLFSYCHMRLVEAVGF